jgi:hypothetical protein
MIVEQTTEHVPAAHTARKLEFPPKPRPSNHTVEHYITTNMEPPNPRYCECNSRPGPF